MPRKKKNEPDLIDTIFNIISFFATNEETKVIKKKQRSRKMRKHEPELLKFKPIQKSDAGSVDEFEKYLADNPSTIGLIVGKRGAGKSAVALKTLENVCAKTGRKCQALGFNAAELPGWIDCVDSIDELQNDSFVVMDESGVLFSSRSSMGKVNKMLSNLLFVSRHKNMSILFITQNSCNVDINIIRQLDYIMLKKSALVQLDFERSKIKKIYEETDERFNELYNDHIGLTYIYSDVFRGFMENTLPSFWGEEISKNFKDT